ncbi:Acid phosphatase [Phytophthora nicotianae]|uniref:Purple acid phosphatase n=1 Tax=Phytophthora nicotianae TaxID=4792 RepID=A0A0W8CEX6_PHYNI|nr:Acid phosphatase [Phytophthora nicotianae]
MLKAVAIWFMAIAAATAHAAVTLNNTDCFWDSTTCLPTALCDLTGGDAQPCRVKDNVDYYPQQIHLAYAGKIAGTAMTVSWATYANIDGSSVWVGCSEDTLELVDTPVTQINYYHDATYNLFHHHATISGLTPHTKYYYKVGSNANAAHTSDVYSFVTARAASDESTFNMLIYGDFGAGNESKDTLADVNTLNADNVDFIFHIGDISYADDAWLMPGQFEGFFYEKVYNGWMNSMAPVMSSVPYMVLVGNHEAGCHSPACGESAERMSMLKNYTAYNSRFHMPSEEVGGAMNMWYSFEHGPIHFTSISSETDYVGEPSSAWSSKIGHFGDQLAWVEADLKKADENRANVPWVIVGMHRPLYDVSGCPGGIPTEQNAFIQAAFENLLIKYKVDVVLMGHQHYYERQMPIRNSTAVVDGVSSDFKRCNNPKAPVYILTGACGTVEGLDPAPTGNNVTWNVVSNYVDYGFSSLDANRSMLSWKFLNSSNQAVLDEFVMLTFA